MMILPRNQTSAAIFPAPGISTENHGPQILAITGSMALSSTFVVCLRIYVKIKVLKKVRKDDYTVSFPISTTVKLALIML